MGNLCLWIPGDLIKLQLQISGAGRYISKVDLAEAQSIPPESSRA